jgi:imidazolonepropionase-like amidohydrolase
MRNRTALSITGCLCTVLAPTLSQAQTAQNQTVVAIRNARIITVSGPEIASGTILIVDGKIKALGASISIPQRATVIDATGKVVMPGLVDANARFGLRATANEQSSEVTPQMRVLQQINPRSPEIRRALQSGVTSACITPGSENVVGGMCGVIKTSGDSLKQMLLREDIAELAALGEDTFSGNGAFLRAGGAGLDSIYLRRPNTRMGAVFELRRALDQPEKYPMMARVRAGTLPLRVNARVANDIRAAITIADEFKVPHLIIDDCIEGYRDIDVLAERHIPVILGPFSDPQAFAPERSATSLNCAGLLTAAGITVAFGTNGGDETQLRMSAILAVRNGMSADLALKAITQTAAEISGVGDRVGSLQVGKDADILILDGDPLEMTTSIEKVLINGQVVYRAE